MLVLEGDDLTISKSTGVLHEVNGIPLITNNNVDSLRDIDVLIVNGHGNGQTIAGLTGKQLGDYIKSLGIKPKAVDVIACCRIPGPARQDLSNSLNVPVRGTKGRTGISSDGKQWIWDEQKTSKKGDPDKPENYVFYPEGEGYEIFRQKNKD